ncbi:Extracellular protein 52 [Teratosphaeria destructans]|uniref:Extracellular protein 52 n=1 Tax=Teratosphaeria destructans TaxID=418781 RepID=A0A9W7W6I9_9PEZI|nr:Extracellular protein 52 [Teratosphaeria destructans]
MLARFTGLAVASTLLLPALTTACLNWNASISEYNTLTFYAADDANNNNITDPVKEPADTICQGTDIVVSGSNGSFQDLGHWFVPCSKDGAELQVFRDATNPYFIDVVYAYYNPEAAAELQPGDPQFYFNWRGASLNGKTWKGREFCAQYDLLRLIKPEALKNECDSLDTC